MLSGVMALMFALPSLALILWSPIKACRSRNPRYLLLAAGALLVEGYAIRMAHFQMHEWDGVEFSKNVEPSQIVGLWRDWRGATIDLRTDGGCISSSGLCHTWRTGSGWVNEIVTEGQLFIAMDSDGGLLLVPIRNENQDPDEWFRSAAYLKVPGR